MSFTGRQAGCLTLFMLGSALWLSGASEWTLEALLRETRTENPEARMAEDRQRRAEALLEQAQSTRLPQVMVNGAYSRTDEPLRAFGAILNTGTFGPDLDFNRPGTADHLHLQLMVVQPLYRGGATTAQVEAARLMRSASEWERQATVEHLSLAVIRAYFAALQAGDSQEALEAEVRNLTESLRVARARHERGQLLESELLNIEVQRAQVEEQLLGAEHQRRLAEKALLVLMGRKPEGGLHLSREASWPATMETAIEDRWEVLAQRAAVAAAENRLVASEAATRPQVDAFAGLQYDRSWRFNGDGEHWMAGLRVQWSIFDGRRSQSLAAQARAELGEARAAQRRLELEVEMQREQARLSLELAQRQYAVASARVDQADKSAAISRARFETGDLLTTELIGAESRLTQARIRRATAALQLQAAAMELRWASGLSLLPSADGAVSPTHLQNY